MTRFKKQKESSYWGDNKIEDTILSRLDKLINDLKEIRKNTDRILNHSIFDGKENE
jgi:hypothetical protein